MWRSSVDAVDGDEYVVFRVEVGMWWRLPSRRILRETRSPEEWAAIRATQRAESRLRVQETLRTMRERGTARAAPREVDYGIIHRQGTAFSPGDYGIARET
jgi:hypothetical protein